MQTESYKFAVFPYRIGRNNKVEYLGKVDFPEFLSEFLGRSTPAMLPHVGDAVGITLTPRLSEKLLNAVDLMKSGVVVDVKVVVMRGNGLATIQGFHRYPQEADRDNDSILILKVNQRGHLSEKRFKPSDMGTGAMAVVFGGGHVKSQ